MNGDMLPDANASESGCSDDSTLASCLAAHPRRHVAVRVAGHLLLAGLFVVAIVLAARWGLEVRKWTYEHTTKIRHFYDIEHNLHYGGRAIDDGVLNLYGDIIRETPNGDYGLDYPPLRLVTMRQWVVCVREHYDHPSRWRPEFNFTKPLLYFNTVLEALSAVAIFLLIRLWVRRDDRARSREFDAFINSSPQGGSSVALSPWRGCLPGFIGAMLMWFSPALMISAHGWPSWDIWIVPFYLYAVLLACVNWWFAAGVVLGIGTMFKGQQLMVVPLFLLWPLFMRRWGAPLRWLSGYLFAVAVVVSPWLLRDEQTRLAIPAARAWVAGGVGAWLCLVAGKWLAQHKNWAGGKIWRVFGGTIAAGLLIWPALRAGYRDQFPLLAALALVIVLFGIFLPWRKYGYLLAGDIGLCLLLSPKFFNSDLTWWALGFRYGSEKFSNLAQWASDALPSLLQLRFGWKSLQDVLYTIQPHALWLWSDQPVEVSLRIGLVTLYAVTLILCAWGMSRQQRRGDRHFLAAMAAPWILAFAFMPQMHGRYLLFGASVGALMAGVGLGMVLLDVMMIGLAWVMTIHMLTGSRARILGIGEYLGDWAPGVYRFAVKGFPDLAWPIMLIALIFLYVGLVPSRRRRVRRGFHRRSPSAQAIDAHSSQCTGRVAEVQRLDSIEE